jgi:hypothetical protein
VETWGKSQGIVFKMPCQPGLPTSYWLLAQLGKALGFFIAFRKKSYFRIVVLWEISQNRISSVWPWNLKQNLLIQKQKYWYFLFLNFHCEWKVEIRSCLQPIFRLFYPKFINISFEAKVYFNIRKLFLFSGIPFKDKIIYNLSHYIEYMWLINPFNLDSLPKTCFSSE